jgi:hypothetical protein
VKNLKFLIVAFGALGLVILLSEFEMFKALLTHPFVEGGFGAIMIGGFVLPVIMGTLGILRPPLKMAPAIVALAGFAAIAVKTKVWEALPHIMDEPIKGKLTLVAIVGGVIVSLLAVIKPEDA